MDSKLQEILLDYGLEGYGLYWYCLEMIVNKIDADNLTFELEHDARIIARNTGSTVKKISEMMLRFVELDLFQNSEGRVTCLKLLQRLDKSMTSNAKFRNMLAKAKESHDSVMIKPDLVMQDKITLEEIREDKNIKDIVQQAAPCTFEEDFNYFWVNSGLKKLNKKAAKPAFKKAMKYLKLDSLDTATKLTIDCQSRLIAMQQGFDMIHPTTYLNGQRWEDEIVVNQTKPRFANQKPDKPQMYEQTMNIEDF